MPEVVRGSRASLQLARNATPVSPTQETRAVHFEPASPAVEDTPTPGLNAVDTGLSTDSARRRSSQHKRRRTQDMSSPERAAYYDSRAATKREFRRRASTLQEYYQDHPELLPQLPFTWRHGLKRWKLFLTIFIMFVDACVIPIVLYYSMKFAGHVQGWIIFAVVATIWGGPAYVEFAVRSWRLIKKENFFRPLGTSNRWAFDITHWISSLTIAAVTAFLIIGSAPHNVWLRVLSMPGPAILYCIGGSVFLITMYSLTGRKAPFRISSTPKGGDVYPGVYYIMEDVIAVNASAGRPFREALAARYAASPRFRRMVKTQSLFWSIPAIVVAIACTVVIIIHPVSKEVAYGIGWGVPFVWIIIWAAIAIPWIRRDMHKETVTWEEDCGIVPEKKHKHAVSDLENGEATSKEPKVPEPAH
ncbi:hypothetical protein PV08_03362 [Exophiala spinifera]|uniref:Uncharacterized protein n=1 Tax=Exophiala spinifera TaxID=91928 RepID=A0A0D2A2C4_9EURO|nr:uncharacterized protein PV08_03362 [Exophiala spinifera]KIW19072.1 hypothetical protein PV08_03362 [Exophiala spinifera]